MYRVCLSGEEIGTTALESADPPMGCVSGVIAFCVSTSPYHLFLNHCQLHNVTVNEIDPEHEFIDTQTIPDLRVFRADGFEISGIGRCIVGFREGGYEITVLGIPYPFYAEEFPHHRRAYDESFKA